MTHFYCFPVCPSCWPIYADNIICNGNLLYFIQCVCVLCNILDVLWHIQAYVRI